MPAPAKQLSKFTPAAEFGPMIAAVEAGADVVEIGLGPTPLLYFAAHHLGTDGAVMITGSPNSWNEVPF